MTTSPTVATQHDGRQRRWDYESWTLRSERPLLAAALVFIGLLVIQALTPERPRAATLLLRAGEMLVWAAFAVDYVVRYRLALDRRHYVRHHLLDLLALAVPFLRPLRLVTLVGVFGTSARRAGDDIRNSLVFVTGLVVLLVLAGAALVLDAERAAEEPNITTFGDAVWWAAVTITTVGYGDRFPVTSEGRAVAVLLMLIGVALLGLVTASVATWFVRVSAQEQEAQEHDERTQALTTLLLIAERVERLEAAQRNAGPCEHCGRLPGARPSEPSGAAGPDAAA